MGTKRRFTAARVRSLWVDNGHEATAPKTSLLTQSGHRHRDGDAGLLQHGFRGPGAIVPHCLEGIKVAGDSFAHVAIKRLVSGRQIGGGDSGRRINNP